jgi:hypothetical protein
MVPMRNAGNYIFILQIFNNTDMRVTTNLRSIFVKNKIQELVGIVTSLLWDSYRIKMWLLTLGFLYFIYRRHCKESVYMDESNQRSI